MTIMSRRHEPDRATLALAGLILSLFCAIITAQCTRPAPSEAEEYGPYYIVYPDTGAACTPQPQCEDPEPPRPPAKKGLDNAQ